VGDFETAQVDALPRWLRDREGDAFARSFGKTKDNELTLLKGAVKLPWPTVGPDDALARQGRDRSIRRAPIETSNQYRTRLLDPWTFWKRGGTKRGIVQLFEPYGYTTSTAHVLNNHEADWDGNTVWWSRFFIFLDPGVFGIGFTDDKNWDDAGNYDDGGVWDSSATVADLDYLRASIRDMKWPGAYPVAIAAFLDPNDNGDGFWNSGGFYDDGGFWDEFEEGFYNDVTYWLLGETWDQHLWLGGGAGIWDEPGAVWGDFVPPTGGWTVE